MAAGTGETRALRSEVVSYYAGGPWYGYSGWSDYAARDSIACTPGTLVKAVNGSMYRCQAQNITSASERTRRRA